MLAGAVAVEALGVGLSAEALPSAFRPLSCLARPPHNDAVQCSGVAVVVARSVLPPHDTHRKAIENGKVQRFSSFPALNRCWRLFMRCLLHSIVVVVTLPPLRKRFPKLLHRQRLFLRLQEKKPAREQNKNKESPSEAKNHCSITLIMATKASSTSGARSI